MDASKSKSFPAIGFLTVAPSARGLVGGYLVLNAAARPLEFHCTAPVRANRAQEILYGPTLRPYLYGEQIGQTLLSRAKNQPLIVVTDVQDVLAARSFTDVPLVYVRPGRAAHEPSAEAAAGPALSAPDAAARPAALDRDAAAGALARSSDLVEFDLGVYRVAVSRLYQDDCQTVSGCWQSGIGDMDLHEPFERIQEAIHEAQKASA
jgi:hypothetical protein